MSSRTRSHFAGSQSAPSTSSMRDHSERRGGHKGRRARELTCETCGKVYKHPVCLQKHRWEHNPLWRDTAQLLLSKHQQVQVMEAAAILIYGSALPPDRALWPSYMSGGRLPSPRLAGDGTLRELTPQVHARAISPAPTVSSSAARDDLPSDTEELEELEEQQDETPEDPSPAEEEDETDESDVPIPHAVSTPNMGTRGRSQSLAAPIQSHMPNLYGSYGAGSHAAMVGYGWGVIGEIGQHGAVNKSPALDAHTSPITSPRSPMAIPADAMTPSVPHVAAHHHGHHHSISSFGSFTSSSSSFVAFGSASTSSYIPSSSVRSGGGDWQDKVEEENGDMDGMDMDDDTFAYGSRASSLYKRLAAVTGNSASSAGGFLNTAVASKSTSLERRREEYMYDMDMD